MLYIYFVLPWTIVDCRECNFKGFYILSHDLHDFFNLPFFFFPTGILFYNMRLKNGEVTFIRKCSGTC